MCVERALARTHTQANTSSTLLAGGERSPVLSIAFHPTYPSLLAIAANNRLAFYDWRKEELVDEVFVADTERVR
jgi:hypothetical protein